MKEDHVVDQNLQEAVFPLDSFKRIKGTTPNLDFPISRTKLPPSILQVPKLEVKPLLEHLKYVFSCEGETLPVETSNKLNQIEEEKLVSELHEHKKAVGWTIANIKGISSSTYTHRIILEKDSKFNRQVQRRLNLPMVEVVKKEVLKLLNARVIYPISDSKRLSPVQVGPKNIKIIVIEK